MSTLFKLDLKDLAKGVVTAVIASVLLFVYNALTNNAPIDWNQVLQLAMSSGLGYLVKNLLTDQEGKLLGKF